jgi:AraC-like DNA-binding protein
MAKPYFLKALNLAQNMTETVKVLNNLGIVETELKNSDSAFYYIKKSLQLREEHQLNVSPEIMHTIATIHKMKQQYDSAFYYYRLSLQKSKETNHIEGEIVTLNALGTLFIEVNNIDSALLYINRSIAIAEKKNYLSTLALNYKLLSKIAELKGNIKLSFEHYKTYTNLKESIYNANIFGDINMLQRSYEVSKTNQQIEKLIVEQRIKENTIRYQKIIWFITLFVLALVSIGLLYIYLQKRDLNKAYKLLVEKNIEVIESQGSSVEVYRKKYKKTLIAHNLQDELLDKILIQMENVCVICDTEFSINKLAELVQSNQTYVSQIINTTFKKNFRSFLNSYRIREVQRLFSEPDIAKYTFESLALRVGYKSPKSFREAFKEITGVTPNFYLKALQEGKI